MNSTQHHGVAPNSHISDIGHDHCAKVLRLFAPFLLVDLPMNVSTD